MGMDKYEALEVIEEHSFVFLSANKKLEEALRVIKDEIIPRKLFLLSVEEYEKYKDSIPLVKRWVWLRSPGISSYSAASVRSDGSVRAYGDVVSYTRGIRPALKVDESEISDMGIGERRIYYDFPFIKIDEGLLIAEVPIAFDKFDDEVNDYEKSWVKNYLEQWRWSR